MSILYSELKNEVIGNLEISSTDYAKYKVQEHLNQIQIKLLNIVEFKLLDNALKTVIFDLTINVPNYQWPNDFHRFYKLWLDLVSTSDPADNRREARPYDHELHVQPIEEVSSKRFPMVDLDLEGGYQIAPGPTATKPSGGRLRYIWTLPDMGDSQNCLLHGRFKSLLVHGATDLSARVDNYRPTLADAHKAMFDAEIKPFLPKEALKVRKP